MVVASTSPYDREIRISETFPVSIERLWSAWTTEAGLASFLSNNVTMEARIGGKFEILFDLSQPEGLQGSEWCRIIAFEPEKRLAFTWNAPPHLPTVRKQRTVCDLRFASGTVDEATLTFVHRGWGEGSEWDQAFEYFQHAWGHVFSMMRKEFV